MANMAGATEAEKQAQGILESRKKKTKLDEASDAVKKTLKKLL